MVLMDVAMLDKLSLGAASSYENLTLTPILLKDGPLLEIDLQSLDEALAESAITISEVSAEGLVSELRVKNSGDKPVLILDGEEVIGAKQNRIVNLTIVVPPEADVVIPVSCIEAGRWAYSHPTFAAAGRVLSQKARSGKAESVSRNLKKRYLRCADQHAVWDDVGRDLCLLGVDSPTRALSDAYDSRAEAIDSYCNAFKISPGQAGLIYRINGVLAGLDLLGCERTFAHAFPKLLRGSALQALTGRETQESSSSDDYRFLAGAVTAKADRFPAVGLGEELRIDADNIGGGALELDGALIHLFAYPRR
jgi:hypothetical protein